MNTEQIRAKNGKTLRLAHTLQGEVWTWRSDKIEKVKRNKIVPGITWIRAVIQIFHFILWCALMDGDIFFGAYFPAWLIFVLAFSFLVCAITKQPISLLFPHSFLLSIWLLFWWYGWFGAWYDWMAGRMSPIELQQEQQEILVRQKESLDARHPGCPLAMPLHEFKICMGYEP